MKIEIGAVVRLKSGGPMMTVISLSRDEDRVTCAWFTVDETASSGSFPTASLVLAP